MWLIWNSNQSQHKNIINWKICEVIVQMTPDNHQSSKNGEKWYWVYNWYKVGNEYQHIHLLDIKQIKTVLGGQKKRQWITKVMSNIIVNICVMLERRKYFSSWKVMKDWKHETWPKDPKKFVDIRGEAIMVRIFQVPKNGNDSLYKMKMK